MKRFNLSPSLLVLSICTFLLQGCIKDTCEASHRYTYYTPVYKTKAEVRANIKNNPQKKFLIPLKYLSSANTFF